MILSIEPIFINKTVMSSLEENLLVNAESPTLIDLLSANSLVAPFSELLSVSKCLVHNLKIKRGI